MKNLITDNDLIEVTYDILLHGQEASNLIGYREDFKHFQKEDYLDVQYFEYFEEDNVDKADRLDYIIAASSGFITGLIDIFWVKEFSIDRAHLWGKEKTNDFVISVAQKVNILDKESNKEIKNLEDAIKYLEKKFPLPSDGVTNEFGGGLQHHLRDFSHHPTIIGLIFSLLTQFTGYGYGTDKSGNFIILEIKDKSFIGKDIPTKIFNGTVNWAFHLVSDMAGSSNNPGYGTGIPGPLLSILKEISVLPLVKDIQVKYKNNKIDLSTWISKVFNGDLFERNVNRLKDRDRFDLRFEMGLANEVGRQAMPVVMNECLVRSFYTVDRFFKEVEKQSVTTISEIKNLDPDNFLPRNSRSLKRMLTVSSGIFLITDFTAATVQSKTPLGFIVRINFVGVGRFVFAIKNDAKFIHEDVEDAYYEYMRDHNQEFYENEFNKSRIKHLVLDEKQTQILFSLQEQAILYDIDKTKGDLESKEKWLDEWKHLVAENLGVVTDEFFINNEKEIYHSINEESLNKKAHHWLELIILEMINFNPYVLLKEEDSELETTKKLKELRKLKFRNDYIIERFSKMQFVMEEDEVKGVIKVFDESRNKLTRSFTKMLIGLGGTAIAATLTGGLAFVYAPQIAVLLAGSSVAGLSGAALTNASLAMLGGGALAAGGSGMAGGAALIAGGGAIMGTLGTGALAASTMSVSKEFTLMECSKLLTYSTLIVEDQPEVVNGIYISSKTMIDNMEFELNSQEEQLDKINLNINNLNITLDKDRGLLKASNSKKKSLETYINKIVGEAKDEKVDLEKIEESNLLLNRTIKINEESLKNTEKDKKDLTRKIKETETSTTYFKRFEEELEKLLQNNDFETVIQIEI